jgi:hypothetical protein
VFAGLWWRSSNNTYIFLFYFILCVLTLEVLTKYEIWFMWNMLRFCSSTKWWEICPTQMSFRVV